jgi:BirA family transcriptional regulator, biotin operon repressor / biotin---[acetyl-CoA-carboxylase] ligase
MTAELHRAARIGSTMDRLHELAAQGAPAGTAVVAEAQTGGRGSRGRVWESPPGGLWLSVLYRPRSAAGAELLSLRLGLAVAEALEKVAPSLRLALKWPNDLILADRKVGGILCEARWQGESLAWIVAGLGVNVANATPERLRSTAVAVALLAPDVTVEALLPEVLERLRQPVAEQDRLAREERDRLAARDWLRGRALRSPVAGRAEGIAEDGALLVRSGDVVTPVRAGHVELAEPAFTR